MKFHFIVSAILFSTALCAQPLTIDNLQSNTLSVVGPKGAAIVSYAGAGASYLNFPSDSGTVATQNWVKNYQVFRRLSGSAYTFTKTGIGTEYPQAQMHVSTADTGAVLYLQSANNSASGGASIAFRNTTRRWNAGLSSGTPFSTYENMFTIGDSILGRHHLTMTETGEMVLGDGGPSNNKVLIPHSDTGWYSALKIWNQGTKSEDGVASIEFQKNFDYPWRIGVPGNTRSPGNILAVIRSDHYIPFCVVPSGNVGVGTTTPANTLDVNGGITTRFLMKYENVSTTPATPASGCIIYSIGNKLHYLCAGGTDTVLP